LFHTLSVTRQPRRRFLTVAERFTRKHAFALIAAALFNVIIFFPLLFMGRALSPDDVLYNFAPWSSLADHTPQNPLLTEPATTTVSLMSVVRAMPAVLHWNPFAAGGSAGIVAIESGALSPFFLLPAFLLPAMLFASGVVFLKFNISFVAAHAWLREERMGKRASAIGALIAAGSGTYVVWWLWQVTNATALYPAVLLLIVRGLRQRRPGVTVPLLVMISLLLAGSTPPAIWIGLLGAVYLVAVALDRKRSPKALIGSLLIAGVCALLIMAPVLASSREASREMATRPSPAGEPFSWSHLVTVASAEGGGSEKESNLIDTTVYAGALTLPLAFLGIVAKARERRRWFWAALLVALLSTLFGGPAFSTWIPGHASFPLRRLALLLPIPLAWLSAAGVLALENLIRRRAGMRWRPNLARVVLMSLLLVQAWQLGSFAAAFFPYLPYRQPSLPQSGTIEFLRRQSGLFRVAPFFDYLPPNTAQRFGIEDIRTRQKSELSYQRLLRRIDPGSVAPSSGLIGFNSLNFGITDPLVSFLGVRYVVESPAIDIVRWSIYSHTVPGVPPEGSVLIKNRSRVERTIAVDENLWAVEIPMAFESVTKPGARLIFTLILPEGGEVLHTVAYPADELRRMEKVYVPIKAWSSAGSALQLRIESDGVVARIAAESSPKGPVPFFYGKVRWPVILLRNLEDGRIFENLAASPRFFPVRQVLEMSDDAFLAAKGLDLREVAAVQSGSGALSRLFESGADSAVVRLREYGPRQVRLETVAALPFLLASSEKLHGELAITVDGRRAQPVRINMMFAAVEVPAGSHEVVFERQLGRGRWWASWLGGALWMVAVVVRRRRS